MSRSIRETGEIPDEFPEADFDAFVQALVEEGIPEETMNEEISRGTYVGRSRDRCTPGSRTRPDTWRFGASGTPFWPRLCAF